MVRIISIVQYVLDLNLFLPMARLEKLDKVTLELSAVVLDETFRVLADNHHVANMAL